MKFAEARRDVQAILSANDPATAAGEYAANTDDPNRLKVAQYALLVPVIGQGLNDYLSTPLEKDPESAVPSKLVETIESRVADPIVETYLNSPHRGAIHAIAKRRSEIVSYGRMIYPMIGALRQASAFSVDSMVLLATSSGFTINKATPQSEMPRQDFIEAVKKSHNMALARAVMHFSWNSPIAEALGAHGKSFIHDERDGNSDAVVYNPTLKRAQLDRPFNKWSIGGVVVETDGEKKPLLPIDSIPVEDVRAGCPLSFEPTLLKAYYERIVDEMELRRVWPYMLEGPRDIPLEVERAFGSMMMRSLAQRG
jgi:hypothetical protein